MAKEKMHQSILTIKNLFTAKEDNQEEDHEENQKMMKKMQLK